MPTNGLSRKENDELDRLVIQVDTQQGLRMIEEVTNFLGRFVCYPSEDAHVAHALWCIHTHLMDLWDSTPRIAFLSPEPESGKTRALEATELLVPNPVVAVNMSPAYLFRKVGADENATILFDEIDTIFGAKAKEHEEIRGLLNAGHRRGAVAGRCVFRGKEIIAEECPAYSAVALAGLGWLPDTIMSRSIVIRMRRRRDDEQVEPFRHRIHKAEGDAVRQKIEIWARANAEAIVFPEQLPAEIRDRKADMWEPLLAIADAIGGHWGNRAREAAVALVTDVTLIREGSLGVRLLTDLKTVFEDRDRMLSKTILSALIAIDEAPWGDLRGKPIDERGLANRLRAYGIKSSSVRVGDTTGKGYRREDLHDVWVRYLPHPSDKSVTSVTPVTELFRADGGRG
jgi:hypothetical protein